MSQFENFIKKDSDIISEMNIFDGNKEFCFSNETEIEDFARAVAYNQASEDPSLDILSEILLKSIIYYLLELSNIPLNLNSCLDIVNKTLYYLEYGRLFSEYIKYFPDEHPAKVSFSSIDILPNDTFKSVFETLQKKLQDSII